MTKATRRRWLGLGVALVVLVCTACGDGFLLDDVSFDKWCGDTLCYWTVDAGKIRQVPTWHEKDHGVELVGSGAQISQRSSARSVDCMAFDLISDIEPGARVSVEVDFNDDGTVDFENVLPAQRWMPNEFQIRTPARYSGFRLSVRKEGAGRAVVAQMGLREDLDSPCVGKPLQIDPQGEGAACRRGGECLDGVCFEGSCTLCAEDGSCQAGAACQEDAHCAGGFGCVQEVCSACDTDADCDGECVVLWPYYDEDAPMVCEKPGHSG